MRKSIVVISIALLFNTARATIWYVPGSISTIEAALDSCAVGDTVLVGSGTYEENLVWPSTNGIDLISEQGADSTTIDGTRSDRVIEIATGVDTSTIIKGFTITNGYVVDSSGAGIYCDGSSPIIRDNVIHNNKCLHGNGAGICCVNNSSAVIFGNTIVNDTAEGGLGHHTFGGGIYLFNSSPIIRGNTIGNNAGYECGGIACDSASPTIVGNTVDSNASRGIICINRSSVTIDSNLITWNTSQSDDGGGICGKWSTLTITRNTITHNSARIGGAIYLTHACSTMITHNTIDSNVGNYSVAGVAVGDYGVISRNTIRGNVATLTGPGGLQCAGTFTISHNTITDNAVADSMHPEWGGGILCNAGSIEIYGCLISNNTGDGISCSDNASPIIHYNDIIDNVGYAIRSANTGDTVDAEYNWYGAASGPYHPSANPGGGGDTVSDYVDFAPWLTDLVYDSIPPSAPYITQVEKDQQAHVVLTWTAVTTDTLGNSEPIEYYIVYRDSSADYVPSSDDSIGIVVPPDTSYCDSSALGDSADYYYLVKAVDYLLDKSRKSNMGYKLSKFFNENAATTDKNWVSLPWHSDYANVAALVADLSPKGDPLTVITRLDDTLQQYESYLWNDVFGMWLGSNFEIESDRAYEMITTEDTSLILVGSNDPDGLVNLNENPTTTDRNWVSIPYNAVYATASDITDEYSSKGHAIEKITNLRDDQFYESWLWDPLFQEWGGTDFTIESGRGYEMVAVTDTTWDPTEYSNEAKGMYVAEAGHTSMRANAILGSSTECDRAPVWVRSDVGNDRALEAVITTNDDYQGADAYKVYTARVRAADDQTKSKHSVSELEEEHGEKGGPGVEPDDSKISHTVRSCLTSARGFENIVFTTYRVDLPEDVLTEKIVGSATMANDQLGVIWFDAGNFKLPWKHGQKAVLIIEATKQNKPYYGVIDYVLDEKVDIQQLKDIKLTPMPEPGSRAFTHAALLRDIRGNDNIVGYSLYREGKRLNSTVLREAQSVADNVNLRLVIKGGHETVYSSDGIQSMPGQETPISFAFSMAPNPFVKQVRMNYAVPTQAHVEAVIYDVTGRQVRVLASGERSPGYYSMAWDGTDNGGRTLPSGIYFIKFKAGDYCARNKILLIR